MHPTSEDPMTKVIELELQMLDEGIALADAW